MSSFLCFRFGLYLFEEGVELIEVSIWVDFPCNIMSSLRDLIFLLELGIDCTVDEFCHLLSRHYFISKRPDEENGLLCQHYSIFRWPEVALQEGEGR